VARLRGRAVRGDRLAPSTWQALVASVPAAAGERRHGSVSPTNAWERTVGSGVSGSGWVCNARTLAPLGVAAVSPSRGRRYTTTDSVAGALGYVDSVGH
jgi:hypothetical protein